MSVSEVFKKHISDIFTRSSLTYDKVGPHVFTHFGNNLVQYANIKDGTHVLDVACGKGAVLFPALNSVSKNGYVTGIDLSAGIKKLGTGKLL